MSIPSVLVIHIRECILKKLRQYFFFCIKVLIAELFRWAKLWKQISNNSETISILRYLHKG